MNRYYSLGDYLKKRFNKKVYKITLDGGFTCPNRDGTVAEGGCTYCAPDAVRPRGLSAETTVTAQLDKGVTWVGTRYGADSFIAYFQMGSNTYAPVDKLRSLYTEALSHPKVVGISVSTRPDCITEEILDLIEELSKRTELWLELGLQSSNDVTLKRINRGHTSDAFKDAARGATARGIKVTAHLIVGLPGETREDQLRTIDFISDLDIWGVKFHQLQIVKGTHMEEAYNRGEITLQGLEEYAHVVVECLEHLSPETVIHRLSGDTPRELLVAPRSSGDRLEISRRIEELLEERDTHQGTSYKNRKATS
ncbi:MAG: TIGR01212 family radical SAM protein [Thermodesulfobacteriota bacterium]